MLGLKSIHVSKTIELLHQYEQYGKKRKKKEQYGKKVCDKHKQKLMA